MRIAQVAPPWLSVPPTGYGGTEIVIHYLTEGLVKRGHEVTLFASGDSETSAHLSSIYPKALGNGGSMKNEALHPLLHYIECFEKSEQFDVIHNHAQYYAMFLADLVKTPVLHTIHGSYTQESTPEEKIHTLKRFKNHNFVSISNNQRNDLRELNYVATVYNGIDISLFTYREKKGEYLLWVGRITQKKGPVDAIAVAKKLSMRLKIAAAIDPIEQSYFEKEVKPQIDGKQISFVGEIDAKEKIALYQNAFCVLYPIHWEEPFGLVMVEAMSCGTPVVAFNRGSVAELIADGETGFIIDPLGSHKTKGTYIVKKEGIDGMIEAVGRINDIKRSACRWHIEKHFTVEQMVDNYEKVYNKMVES